MRLLAATSVANQGSFVLENCWGKMNYKIFRREASPFPFRRLIADTENASILTKLQGVPVFGSLGAFQAQPLRLPAGSQRAQSHSAESSQRNLLGGSQVFNPILRQSNVDCSDLTLI